MEQQVEKLKLNVTNIKNSLFSNNKELKKIEKDKTNLFSRLDKKRTLREEESRLESKNLGIGSGFSKIASTITSPVKGIFDRILEFFGLIAAGILIQNLPIILKQVEDFFNSDFIKGVGNVLGFIGNGILQLAQFVGLFPKSEQDKIKKDADETNKIIDEDIKNADRAERDIINLEKLLGKSEEDNEPEQSIESPQSEPDRAVTPKEPKEPKEPSDTQKPESTQPITAKNPVQSFNRGGTVKSTPEKLSERQAYQPQKSRQSPEGKKAQRDANNGFINFPIAVDKIIDVTKEHEKNILLYADVLKKDRGLRSGITTTSPTSPGPGPGPGPGSRGSNSPLSTSGVITDEIVGHVGSTGRSSGPHIHIETGDGYSGSHGEIPNNILSNIIVDGRPLSSYELGDGLYAGRNHGGFDYPIRSGAPIKLQGGIKFLEYDQGYNSGYGNSLIIVGPDGRKYIIGHLDSGPLNPEKITNPQAKAQGGKNVAPVAPVASPGYGRGGPSLGPLNSSRNQSVFIYAVQPVETYVPFPYPMPVETPVASSSPTPQLSSIWRG